jgi:hypothetical protein
VLGGNNETRTSDHLYDKRLLLPRKNTQTLFLDIVRELSALPLMKFVCVEKYISATEIDEVIVAFQLGLHPQHAHRDRVHGGQGMSWDVKSDHKSIM